MGPKSKKHNKFTRFIFYIPKNLTKLLSKDLYVKCEYKYITGKKLDLKNPKSYTEKLQYLRLKEYPNNIDVIKCASRVGAREYLSTLNLSEYLIPIIGVYNSFDEIEFDSLPNQFVMKCTHASGYNFICYDKNRINMKTLKKQFDKWLNTNYGQKTVEPHYCKIKPQIIIEHLLLENNELPVEYKIHVFNGKAKAMYIVTDRDKDIHYNNYLIDWTPFDDMQFNHWTKSNKEIKKPENWDEMIILSERLANKFPFVRVDLFNINGKIYFNEMTFTPAKGTLVFDNKDIDLVIGNWLNI